MVSIWQIIALPIVEAIAVGALCGLVGSLALLNQRVFFTESITHAAFPGAVPVSYTHLTLPTTPYV